MKNKMKLQKFIALFSAMMLLVTSLGLQVFAGTEEELADAVIYETLGVEEITGLKKWKVEGGQAATPVVEGDLDGVLLDGIYNFSGNGSINFGGGLWTGLMMGFNAEGMVIQYFNGAGNTDWRAAATFSPTETGYAEMFGTDMRVKMGFAFSEKTATTANVIITITVGTATKELVLDAVDVSKFGRSLAVYAGDAIVTVKAAPLNKGLENFTEITPADFGLADGTYGGNGSLSGRKSLNLNSASAKAMTLDGKVISMDAQFAVGGSAIYIGNNGWTGLVFNVNPYNNALFTLFNNASGGIHEGDVFISDTVLDSNFEKFNLKLSFEFVTNDTEGEKNDVKIGVWINGVQSGYYYDNNNTQYYTASISFYNGVTIASPARECALPTDNIPYLLADFGVGDVTSSLVAKAIQPMSESGSSISGKIALSEQSGMTLYGGSGDSGEWLGLRLHMNADKLEICHTGSGAMSTLAISEVKANQPFTFTVAEKVSDWNADDVADDVLIQVWINEKLVGNFYFLEYQNSISKTLLVYPYAAGATMTNYTDVVYANAVDGYVVEGEGTLTVNNTEMAAGTVLQTSGEYIVRCANAGAYVEYVAVYRTGDAHVDNVVDVLDLVAIRNASKGEAQPASKTGKKAADVDGSGAIDATDCAGVRNILAGVQ